MISEPFDAPPSATQEPSVLHITGVRIGGGVPIYVRRTLEEAQRRGAAHSLACAPSSSLYQWIAADGGSAPGKAKDSAASPSRPPIPVYELGDNMTRDAATSVVRIRRVVRQTQPDVVHLHSSEAGVLGRVALGLPIGFRGPRVPVIFQPHAWSFLALDGPLRSAAVALERTLAPIPDHIVCGSNDEAATGRLHGIRSHSVITNAVDVDRFTPIDTPARQRLARELTGLDPDPLVIAVGRLANQKAPDVLLQAWRKVKERLGPRPVLALIGDGPLRDSLEPLADQSVLFVGDVDETLPWHRAADVSVLASRYETLSLSMLESLACGTPVVATRTGGVADVLRSEDPPGQIVEIDDVAGLAAGLEAVARRAPELRDRARQQVLPFNRQAWGDALFALYRNVAASGDRPYPETSELRRS